MTFLVSRRPHTPHVDGTVVTRFNDKSDAVSLHFFSSGWNTAGDPGPHVVLLEHTHPCTCSSEKKRSIYKVSKRWCWWAGVSSKKSKCELHPPCEDCVFIREKKSTGYVYTLVRHRVAGTQVQYPVQGTSSKIHLLEIHFSDNPPWASLAKTLI